MANLDRPCGFRPYGPVKASKVMEAGSAIYPGDAVKLASDGQVDSASAGNTLFGVALTYASAAGADVLVSYDPSQLYTVQSDETEASAQTVVGLNADIVATAGNSTYKASRQELDSSVAAAGGSQQLTIMGYEKRPDNAFGAQVDLIVKINENQLVDSFAGI